MRSFIGDIGELTEDNRHFRRVVHTGAHMQLVLMTLQPGEEIGDEVHEDTDQFFRIEEGKGEVVINGEATRIDSGTGLVIRAGDRHNVRNTGEKPLKMYTLYAPPHHADGTIHLTREDALKAEGIGA